MAAVAIQASGTVLRVANGEAASGVVGCSLLKGVSPTAGREQANRQAFSPQNSFKALETRAPVLLRDASPHIFGTRLRLLRQDRSWRERVD